MKVSKLERQAAMENRRQKLKLMSMKTWKRWMKERRKAGKKDTI